MRDKSFTIHHLPSATDPSLSSFIRTLSTYPSSERITNPYRTNWSRYNKARRHNLRHYLETMARRRPSVLLVGEAPGYRGCRLCGIPFASRQMLEAGEGIFGNGAPYSTAFEWEDVPREASATIMWRTIERLPALPLLWNAFPFHPHRPNQPQTNRAPTARELDVGRPFIEVLLALFPIQTVIAVGNRADNALSRADIPHHKVRHPSHGGKRLFQQQLFELSKNGFL